MKLFYVLFGVILLVGVFGIYFVFAQGSFDPEDERQIGYEFLDDNKVVHIWNTQDDYYFDKSSGIQLTNHYNDYWTRNIFCIGYYNNDEWNKIACADDLSGFERSIITDDETYVNATLWKDIEYGVYDLRLGVQYHLGLDDKNLSITIYGKNIGIDIPYDLGFAWKVTDWEIPHEGIGGNSIRINNTDYELDRTYDLLFKNMTRVYTNWTIDEEGNGVDNGLIIESIPTLRGFDYGEYLTIDWNPNLNYAVKMFGNGNQEDFYVALLINAGYFDSNQEKSTTFYWIDADTGYHSPSATGETYDEWINPTNVYSSDNSDALQNVDTYMQDYYNFNFGVPEGATIDGIEVSIEGESNYAGANDKIEIELSWDSGNTYTNENKQLTYNTGSDEYQNTGGSEDTWGRTWSDTEFSNENFRLRMELISAYTFMRVDHIQVKVYYIEAGDETPPYFTDGTPTNQTIEEGVALAYDINASDETEFDCFAVNDTTNFKIDCEGLLQNNTILDVTLYNLNITINDTSNNLNSTLMWVNVTKYVDTVYPLVDFDSSTPGDGSSQSNTDILVNVTSSDNSGEHSVVVDWNGSLVGWWRMDDLNSSGDPTDISSYSNNGTAVDGASYTVDGKFGGGFEFDGDGDKVEFTPISLDNLTLSAWIFPLTNENVKRTILGGGGSQTPLLDLRNGQIQFGGTGLSNYPALLSTNHEINTWSHVIITYTLNDTARIYVNGIEKDSIEINGSLSSPFKYIGYRSYANSFNGTIDDVQIYNRALTPEEINATYNANLYQYERNFTGLSEATYTYKAYAQDLGGNINMTGERSVTITTVVPEDCWTEETWGIFIPDGCVYEINSGEVG